MKKISAPRFFIKKSHELRRCYQRLSNTNSRLRCCRSTRDQLDQSCSKSASHPSPQLRKGQNRAKKGARSFSAMENSQLVQTQISSKRWSRLQSRQIASGANSRVLSTLFKCSSCLISLLKFLFLCSYQLESIDKF